MDFKKISAAVGPLRYQSSTSDCVPTTVINALLVLLQKRLDPALIRFIWAASLDLGKAGTGSVGSKILAHVLESWFEHAADDKYVKSALNFRSEIISGDSAHLGPNNALIRCLNNGGVACIMTGGDHYSLLLCRSGLTYFGFDPYWNTHQVKRAGTVDYSKYHGLVNRSWSRKELLEGLSANENKWFHLIYPYLRDEA